MTGLSPSGASETARGVQRRILGKNGIRGSSLALNEYAPDTGSAEQPVHHAGLGVRVVLEGELTVEVDDVAYVLRRGRPDLLRPPPGRTGSGNTAQSEFARSG